MSTAETELVSEVAEKLAGTLDMTDAPSEARMIVAFTSSRTAPDRERALAMAERRRSGTPLSHLVGRTRFMGVDLVVEPGVFVVREETELLGRGALRCLSESQRDKSGAELRMIDMGSGSGNLTCALATALPGLLVWASDLEEASVLLTAKNVKITGLESRVSVSQGDLFAPLAGQGLEGSIDAIVCNPPYIATVRLDSDRAHLLDHEPRAAFDGGPYGISLQQRLIKEGVPFLRPGGWILFEFGVGQDRQVKALFDRARAYDRVEFATNAAGEARVGMGRKRPE